MNNSAIEKIEKTLNQYQSGWSLDNSFYNGASIEQFDSLLFRNHWFYAACVCDIPDEGDYITINIGDDSIILIRNGDGEVKGFHNVCCHRGSQVLLDKHGSCANIVCHYHQWTYNLSGQLIYAGSMGADFDVSQFKLQPVLIEVLYGLIFVNMGDYDPSIEDIRKLCTPYLKNYDLENLKIAHVDETIRAANWKLIIENNRECYHCSGNHPSLVNSLLAQGFGNDTSNPEIRKIFDQKEKEWDNLPIEHIEQSFPNDLWMRLIRLPLANNAVSQTKDGSSACDKLIANYDYPETSELSVWTQSNSWHHYLNDHVVTFSVLPIDKDHSMVRTVWLVNKEAVEGEDYNIDHLTHVWKQTNEEDARLFESVMIGMQSSAYKPGPLAVEEKYVASFLDWYVRESKKLVNKLKT